AGNMRPLLPGDRSARSHAGPVRWRGSHSRRGMESGCAKDTKSPATRVARPPAYRCRGLLHERKLRLAKCDALYTEGSMEAQYSDVGWDRSVATLPVTVLM